MNDLPNPPPPQQSPQPPVSSVTTTGNKEVVGVSMNASEGLRDASGKEVAIPKEVAAAGVKVHPTTIPIPPPVAQMGVKPAGANIPVQTTSTVALPLSDTEIAVGLHQSITNSLRWLAEWCIRRMKQVVHVKKSS